ncbi:MAG: 3-hydroxybutyrate dehydrogenase [Pseudomonadota bacterium]|nr:3-hydroxybutyrate dehydrogenase [Pseudomonadota bacterium]
MTLKNKICIVTGGASGIGLGIARRYAADGAKIAIADLKADAAEATAADLAKEFSIEAIGVGMDVSDEEAVNTGVARVADTWGKIDVLVSNAGIQIVHPLEEYPFADWKKLLAIHLDGAFLTSRACLPHMKAAGGGSIIFMGSVHSWEASALKSAYVTAKHGLLGLARVIAKESGKDGIRANVICPGFVKTPLVEKQIPEQAASLGISEKEVVERVMLGETVDKEFTTIEDVAELAHFFAAFPSNALTGQSLIVSHGWHMN